MRKLVTALAGSLLLATGSAGHAALPITEHTIAHKVGSSSIEVKYPQTGNALIDATLANYAKSETRFVIFGKARGEDNAQDVGLSYRITRNDEMMLGVVFTGSVYYAGAAHGQPLGKSFLFLLPRGEDASLPELLDGQRGMEKVGQLTLAEALATYREKNYTPNKEELYRLEQDTGPTSLPFTDFDWTDTELVLHFGPYALGCYACGRDVHIPMAKIKDVIRPNPAAPAPSFDCRTSLTAIEKAICSDPFLARKDRKLAELYRLTLSGLRYRVVSWSLNPKAIRNPKKEAEEAAALRAYIEVQRAWLRRRDEACNSGSKKCLNSLISERMASPAIKLGHP